MGPDLGQIENVPAEFLGLLRTEDLDVTGPGWIFAALNGPEEVLGVPIRIFSGKLSGLLVGQSLAALVSLEVDLNVVETPVRREPLESVSGVAIHVAVRVRGTTITEQMHNLVDCFLMGGQIVPKHGGILEVGLGVPLLGMDEEREL